MAETDAELIKEVRALTDYDASVIPGSEMQELVNIGKEEIKADINKPEGGGNFDFYKDSNRPIDRALFWFVCIAAKIKTGEIGGVNIEIQDFRTDKPAQGHYSIWFENFDKRLREFSNRKTDVGGPAHKLLERDNRSYSYGE